MTKLKLNRRDFMRNTTLVSGAAILPAAMLACEKEKKGKPNKTRANLAGMKNPLAIAMWDYSWMYGMLDRGYNALRIDCFPQFIAADDNEKIDDELLHVRESWKPALWGNDFTMRSHPRKDLIEFMTKCKERGIYIGLSTWFMQHGTSRNLDTTSINDFVRVWDETLQFIKDHDLIQDVIYVDLLNEYPLWHGLEWFKKEMNERGNEELFKENNPDANVPDEVFMQRENGGYTQLQANYSQNFIDATIKKLKAKWPEIPFFASFPGAADLNSVDVSDFDAIDPHYWFGHKVDFAKETGEAELNAEINPVIARRNILAKAVMGEYNIPVNDLFGLLIANLNLSKGDRFHWKAEGYKLMSEQCITYTLKGLQ